MIPTGSFSPDSDAAAPSLSYLGRISCLEPAGSSQFSGPSRWLFSVVFFIGDGAANAEVLPGWGGHFSTVTSSIPGPTVGKG